MCVCELFHLSSAKVPTKELLSRIEIKIHIEMYIEHSFLSEELQSLVEFSGLVGSQLDSDVMNAAWTGPLQLGQRHRLDVVTAPSL